MSDLGKVEYPKMLSKNKDIITLTFVPVDAILTGYKKKVGAFSSI